MLAMLPARPQIALNQLESFITDENWAIEPKLDGIRVLCHFNVDGDLAVYNRGGSRLSFHRADVPEAQIRDVLSHLPVGWYIDGELMEDGSYCLFDLLPTGTYSNMNLRERRDELETLFRRDLDADLDRIRLVAQARLHPDKIQLVLDVYNRNGEGLVLKSLSGMYVAGRTVAVRKLKFTKTLDAVVLETNIDGKDNARLGVRFSNNWVDIGRVSTLNHEVVVDDVVEVRYREISRHGRLIEPVLIRVRHDKGAQACDFTQLEAVALVNAFSEADLEAELNYTQLQVEEA